MNLKKFKIDKSGKTEALFIKDKFLTINKKTINDLVSYSLLKKNDVRICFHSSKKDKLHYMINVILKKKILRAHKHEKTLEFYKIIDGKLKVKFFKKNEKFLKEYILEKNKNEFIKVNPGTYHITTPIGNSCVFLETRVGPFRKSDTKFSKKIYRLT